jgi:hypothetical protein
MTHMAMVEGGQFLTGSLIALLCVGCILALSFSFT